MGYLLCANRSRPAHHSHCPGLWNPSRPSRDHFPHQSRDGALIPPVGMNLFISSIRFEKPVETLCGVPPFYCHSLVCLRHHHLCPLVKPGAAEIKISWSNGVRSSEKSIRKLFYHSFIEILLQTPYSELHSPFSFRKFEDNPVDFFRGFPHGNVAAPFDDMQFRTLDGLMKAFSYGRRKDESLAHPR